MADLVAEGAKEAGAEVDVLTSAEFSADQMDQYDAIAFGCPSMGAEQLEESEFEPMFLSLIHISGIFPHSQQPAGGGIGDAGCHAAAQRA